MDPELTTSFPAFFSEAVLAHASADNVRAAYARSDLFERRQLLMNAWANYCVTPQSVERRTVCRTGQKQSAWLG
jgi:hypothetical protein